MDCETTNARSLNLQSNRFDIEPEITAKLLLAGHRIVERPVTFRPRGRAAGKKINWRDGVRAIQVLVRHRLGLDRAMSPASLPRLADRDTHDGPSASKPLEHRWKT